jgi:ParB family chromosome partitioning protein
MTKQNALFGGVDALFGISGNPNEYEISVNLDDIEVEAQVREELEDEANKLADLGRSLREQQLQAIVIRPNRPGSEKPYLLVAGERRYRAALMEGLTHLRSNVKDFTDEQAEDAQFIENIHRKNLTQIEEAKKIDRDLKKMSQNEVLAKYKINRTRLSKMLGLLNLPEQAKRLVTEDLSADVEVINAVRIIEKHDPEKAKDLVNDLKQSDGKANTRDAVKAVKDSVKPPKKREVKKPAAQVDVFAGAKKPNQDENEQTPDNRPTRESVGLVLSLAYSAIFLQNGTPKSVLDDMSRHDREMIEVWLRAFYEMGVQSKDAGRDALKCLRDEHFAPDGLGAFALAAFMYGVARDTKFSLLDIFGSVKA